MRGRTEKGCRTGRGVGVGRGKLFGVLEAVKGAHGLLGLSAEVEESWRGVAATCGDVVVCYGTWEVSPPHTHTPDPSLPLI